MLDIKINESSESDSVVERVLFDRPVSNLGKTNIAILVGRHARISTISLYYSIFVAMGLRPVIIADIEFKNSAVPADLFMISKDKKSYLNADEALESLLGCGTVLVLTGGEINSALGLLLSRLALIYKGTVVSENLATFEYSWKTASKIAFGTTRKLIQGLGHKTSSQQGLKLKAEYLWQVAEKTDALVMALDSNQAIALDGRDKNSIAVVNSTDNINIEDFSAIAIGLLSEKQSDKIVNPLDYFITAGNLYRKYYSKGGVAGLKTFLSSQF